MSTSCPSSAREPLATSESEPPANPSATPPKVTFRCGLCRSDDHDITDKKCPTKCKAALAKRRAWRRRSEPKAIHTSNRFECLVEDNEDAVEEVAAEPAEYTQPSYRDVLRRSSRHQKKHKLTGKASPVTDELVEVDQQLAVLQAEVTKLSQRRARLIRRSQRQPPEQPCHSSQPGLSQPSLHQQKPVPSIRTQQELLQFVVQQLQNLVSVLAAQLR